MSYKRSRKFFFGTITLLVLLVITSVAFAWHPTINKQKDCNGYSISINPDWEGHAGTIVDEGGDPRSGSWNGKDSASGWVKVEWKNEHGGIEDSGIFDWSVSKPGDCNPEPEYRTRKECRGVDLWEIFEKKEPGKDWEKTGEELIESNSEDCGYVPSDPEQRERIECREGDKWKVVEEWDPESESWTQISEELVEEDSESCTKKSTDKPEKKKASWGVQTFDCFSYILSRLQWHDSQTFDHPNGNKYTISVRNNQNGDLQWYCDPVVAQQQIVTLEQGPGDNTSPWTQPVIGNVEIPSLGLERAIREAFVVNNVINQPTGMIVMWNDDVLIHQAGFPAVGEMQVGEEIIIKGQSYVIASKDVMQKTEASAYVLSHRTIVTCTPDWSENIVFTLVDVSNIQ